MLFQSSSTRSNIQYVCSASKKGTIPKTLFQGYDWGRGCLFYHSELLGLRWDGTSWKNWKPQSVVPIRSPLMPWASLEAAVLQDSSAFVKHRSTEYFKVGKYLELQNETDPSGRVSYWKSRGFVQHPEIENEILRPSGASATIHRGAARPTFRLRGGSRGIFVKKPILKRIHIARLQGSL